MKVIIAQSPIRNQPIDSKLVIHHWRWIVERTISWLDNNRRLNKDYERTILSSQTFIWIAHSRRTLKRVW
ncbi:hypothetical protein EHT87_30975 [Larkinella knui]|uniref:Uncharacterized protein n=1 Tax=Larkinella knui TaxID=2025310 RepID=A0A3P1C9K3_9BACT|nr:transposase [Larkinella knui]RRB09959.1 hypothetical protein EHT87_30975 [Larkinella knui]